MTEQTNDILRPETCREWSPGGDRCDAPADFILWGKMFPPEALGPRCYSHAVDHTSVFMPSQADQWALYDLRRVAAARVNERDRVAAAVRAVVDPWEGDFTPNAMKGWCRGRALDALRSVGHPGKPPGQTGLPEICCNCGRPMFSRPSGGGTHFSADWQGDRCVGMLATATLHDPYWSRSECPAGCGRQAVHCKRCGRCLCPCDNPGKPPASPTPEPRP